MKTAIFSLLAYGSLHYARAQDAQHARRIFSRSLNASLPDGARAIRVSIEQVRYVGRIVPPQLGATGYDAACKRMPERFRDETAGESYMNPQGFESDRIRNNAEDIVSELFAGIG
jgi:hypothetical protein